MGFMPYQLEKGPYWSVVESALGKDPATSYELLLQLRDQTKGVGDTVLASTSLNSGPLKTTAARVEHLNVDWFGWTRSKTGWDPQDESTYDALDINHNHTGFWINYWGDVEAILRRTMVRAIERSLGLAADAELPAGATHERFWPVTVTLKCPTPWFEGWVTWRELGKGPDPASVAHDARYAVRDTGAGEVVVHFLVPGNYGSQVLKVPGNGKVAPPRPAGSQGANGMVLISAPAHARLPGTVTSDPGTSGQWPKPTLGHVIKDDDGLLEIEPTEADGGVEPAGRPYLP